MSRGLGNVSKKTFIARTRKETTTTFLMEIRVSWPLQHPLSVFCMNLYISQIFHLKEKPVFGDLGGGGDHIYILGVGLVSLVDI